MVTAVRRGTLLYCDCHGTIGMAEQHADKVVYHSSRESQLVIKDGMVTIQKESNREKHFLVVDIRFTFMHTQ